MKKRITFRIFRRWQEPPPPPLPPIISTYFDPELGRDIPVYAPGFADGVTPQQVGARNQHLEVSDD